MVLMISVDAIDVIIKFYIFKISKMNILIKKLIYVYNKYIYHSKIT